MGRFSEELTLNMEKYDSSIEDKPHGTVTIRAGHMLHTSCHFHVRRKDNELFDLSELKIERDLKSFNSVLSSLCLKF